MFHRACVLRSLESRSSRWSPSRRTKERIPCFSGSLPVAIVFQTRGDASGICERRGPHTPCRASSARYGRRPAASIGVTTRGLAPSIPTKSTRPRPPPPPHAAENRSTPRSRQGARECRRLTPSDPPQLPQARLDARHVGRHVDRDPAPALDHGAADAVPVLERAQLLELL